MLRILLTHTPATRANYYGDEALGRLRGLGEVRLHEGETPLDTPALIEAARGCDVIVADRQTRGDAALFDALPQLAAMLRCAVDIRTIDVAAASRAGVLVTRATPGFADAVAELALGFMVDLSRGISRSVGAYRSGATPEIRVGLQLSHATVGIIGCGTIGRRIGALCAALGARVLANDPVTLDGADVEQVELDALLSRSDIVICLAPALPETENLMDARAFAAMRRGAFFINLARGELVDEAALIDALDRGHLAGAALDVGRAPDQMPSPMLAARPDVIATPHIGGLTREATQHQAFDTVAQVAALVSGRVPDGAVNAPQATRLARFDIPQA
jgi:D-3-phosphoglycerate dehydrogenase